MHKQELDAVRCQVRCPIGWIAATFHVPRGQALDDYLTHAPPFVATTDVTLLRTGRELAFLDLQLEGVTMVAPFDADTPVLPGNLSETDVMVVVRAGTIDGQLALVPKTRVSDFFAHRQGFFALRAATLHPFERADGIPGTDGPRLLYLNCRHITGIAEIGAEGG